MALVDDLRESLSEDEAARRRFLVALGSGALALAGIGTVVTSVEYMRPNVLFEPATRFPVARPEEIGLGTILVLPKRKLFVVHSPEGFYAMSSICTHLGCMVRHEPGEGSGQAFFCPCHGSRFDPQGNVLGGPAPRPLRRLELELEGGKLVVNTKKEVAEGSVLAI
ncbi:MAG: ubiquinol-cytochrome c reductase iron-sulfur subunit [Planctomycetota bacterium]